MKRVPKIVWSLLACVICIVVTAAACLILADSGASSDKYMEVIRVIETTFYQPKAAPTRKSCYNNPIILSYYLCADFSIFFCILLLKIHISTVFSEQ